MQGVYQIVNTVNGKVYIGSSTDIKQRWRKHRHLLRRGEHPNTHLQSAWNNYGAEAFRFEVVKEVDDAIDLVEREQAWLGVAIAGRREVYNQIHDVERHILSTASRRQISKSLKGYYAAHPVSEEARQKIGAAHRGRKRPAETGRRIGAALRGRKLSAERRAQISAAQKGRILSEEHKHKISEALKGVPRPPMSEEHKHNISEACKGRVSWNKGKKGGIPWNKGLTGLKGHRHTEETRRKMSAAARGRVLTEAQKRHLSEINTGKRHPNWGKHLSEETRHKIGKAHKGIPMSEETKRKISEARKGCKQPFRTKETRRKLSEVSSRPYPAFVHRETGEIIPAGVGLARMCRERGLEDSNMGAVKAGKRQHHKGWQLLEAGA